MNTFLPSTNASLLALATVQSKIWSPVGERAVWKAYSGFLVDDDLWSSIIIGVWLSSLLIQFPWIRSLMAWPSSSELENLLIHFPCIRSLIFHLKFLVRLFMAWPSSSELEKFEKWPSSRFTMYSPVLIWLPVSVAGPSLRTCEAHSEL
jgi:hypothetical protein